MQCDMVHSANSTGRPRGLCTAVAISLAIHGLFGLLFCKLPAIRGHSTNDCPLGEIAVIVVPDEAANPDSRANSVPISIAESNPVAPADRDKLPIRVASLPVESGSGTLDSEAPHVVRPAIPQGPAGNFADKPATFFGLQMPASSVVFIIDRSLSMWFNHGLDAAKRELLEKLDRLPASTRFQIFFYDNKVECVPTTERDGLLSNSDENRRRITRLMESVKGRGGTDHSSALRQALALRPEAILFITDAEDLRRDQVRSITEANRGRTAIHTVQWKPTHEASESLQELARLNRGVYRQFGP